MYNNADSKKMRLRASGSTAFDCWAPAKHNIFLSSKFSTFLSGVYGDLECSNNSCNSEGSGKNARTEG